MDRLLRGINADHTVRVVTAVTSNLVRECCRRHGLRGLEAVVLGRAATAGCLMATLTKVEQERVRIAVQGDGPAGRVLVDAHARGDVRACLERRLPAPEFAASERQRAAIGHLVGPGGRVVVTRDLGLESQYQGVVGLIDGEVDRDLERYLEESEQLPSALACEVVLDRQGEVVRAAGVLCQSFPAAPDDVLSDIRNNLHDDSFIELLHHDRDVHELMGFALLGREFSDMGTQELEFRCNCGPERALAVLATLGATDLEQLAEEPGDTEVRCSYCGETYRVDPDALRALAERVRGQRS